MKCEPPVRGGRTVICVPDRPMFTAGKMLVRVREDVVPGTVLTFTTTPVIDTGTVDTRPENDSKTAEVTVVKPSDMASAWEPSTLLVIQGRPVTVTFAVTNHGPGTIPGLHVVFSTDDSDRALLPRTVPPPGVTCIPDPGTVICGGYAELAPGESHTHTQTWVFGEQHAGRTIHAKAQLGGKHLAETGTGPLPTPENRFTPHGILTVSIHPHEENGTHSYGPGHIPQRLRQQAARRRPRFRPPGSRRSRPAAAT